MRKNILIILLGASLLPAFSNAEVYVHNGQYAFEMYGYDLPLLYHVKTGDDKVALKVIAQLASDAERDPRNTARIAEELMKGWQANDEFRVNDNLRSFNKILKDDTAAIAQLKAFSLTRKAEMTSSESSVDKLTYDFINKGFNVQFSLNAGDQMQIPPNVVCLNYTSRSLCLKAVNLDEVKFIPMNEVVGRKVADLRRSGKIFYRYHFKISTNYEMKKVDINKPEFFIVPIKITSIDLYSGHDRPQSLLFSLNYKN